MLLDSQVRFADEVVRELESLGKRFERIDPRAQEDRVEPCVEIRLETTPGRDVDAVFYVCPDVFQIMINEADVRIEDWGDDFEGWLSHTLQFLRALVTRPLRLKIRRGLFSSSGAVYVELENQGNWSGELFAIWWGREQPPIADWC